MRLQAPPPPFAIAAALLTSILIWTANDALGADTLGSIPHTFTYTPPAGAATVPASVAGDFNGWSADPNPMVRADDGTYSATVNVPPGLHHYKIVYDGKWITDPVNSDHSLETDDGHQGKNSGFIAVGEGANHQPTHTFIYTPPAGAATVAVSVAGDFNGWSADPNPMVRGDDGIYTVTITVPPGLHHYKIVYDGKWIADPINSDHSLESDDGHQGKNSGFIAKPIPDQTPVKPVGDAPTHKDRI